MDFLELAAKRQSCRNFADRPVDPELLRRCLSTAQTAPSACNSQPWSFVVVNDPERSPQVAKCLQDLGMNRFTDNCPAFVVVQEEPVRFAEKLTSKFTHAEFAQLDVGLMTAHFCLAATSFGLSTCIIGWINQPKLKALLDIPQDKPVRLVIAVGYAADETIRAKSRKPLEDITRFL